MVHPIIQVTRVEEDWTISKNKAKMDKSMKTMMKAVQMAWSLPLLRSYPALWAEESSQFHSHMLWRAYMSG